MRMKHVYTIPPDVSFVETLAKRLWQEAAEDPLRLTEALVLLPTRRACRHLREGFLRVTNGRAALLPRMQPLGDVDEAELVFTDDALDPDLPPAIDPLRRKMLLTRLILQKDKNLPYDQAAQLAEALASLIDQVQIERGDFANLHNLVPEEYARHWQDTVRFLDIVTAAWPEIVKAEGCLDPAERRKRVLEARAVSWRKTPPPFPVVAAGSTASMPAVAELMAVIAGSPLGRVVLPGLDQELGEDAWQAIEENHPQYGMKKWLELVEVTRRDVKTWHETTGTRAARVRLLQEAMRPAETTDAWRALAREKIPAQACEGLERLELEHQQEEADVIALRLRAALEEKDKTAALVTPDRALAERVAAALRRWGIEANDSAGAPLTSRAVGGFLRDVIQAASPEASAIDYLSLLKHPLAACGAEPAQCRVFARRIEIAIWRGVRRGDGWQGVVQALRGEESAPELIGFVEQLAQWFEPLVLHWPVPMPLDERIRQHMELAERVAAALDNKGAVVDGAKRLWRGEAGEAAAAFLNAWRQAAQGLPPLAGEDYARLLGELMRGVTVRPAYGLHPRLSILGPLEARLHHADLMILGGMNEGAWPPEAPADPWMSRPMKSKFGLPLPERRAGLSAHDFVQLASAPEVLITRARRVEGSPTVPSRFLLQVEAVLESVRGAGCGVRGADDDLLAPKLPWREWARRLDAPEKVEACDPPEPCPPASKRPRKLSVTEIGTWLRNPYAIYARRVLKLEKLDPIDADVTAADRGTMIHEALENFLKRHKDTWPPDPLETLLAIGREVFAPYRDRPQVAAFWWPRFERIAARFIAREEGLRRSGARVIAAEAKGAVSLADGTFTLTGRADRIDRLPDGTAEIMDYKTGSVPNQKDIERGYEPQLPLLAMIAEEGGFADIGAMNVGRLTYWQLKGGRDDDKIKEIKGGIADLARESRENLERLIAEFDKPLTPYRAVPRPSLAPKHDDYAHLARLDEWGKAGGEE